LIGNGLKQPITERALIGNGLYKPVTDRFNIRNGFSLTSVTKNLGNVRLRNSLPEVHTLVTSIVEANPGVILARLFATGVKQQPLHM
jgi:hypothetical protein